MTAKEKAVYLYEKFLSSTTTYSQAKDSAIIAVEELIKEFEKSDSMHATSFHANYWKDVKSEISGL